MMISKLRIGIDFHGVITEAPAFFRDFSELARQKEYEIHIISGGPYQVEKKFLDAWKIYYTEIFSLVDYFAERGLVTYYKNGNFKVDDDLWNRAKADYCLKNAINIQIDDTEHYGTSFVTPFCLYDAQSSSCRLGDRSIDFSSPEQLLASIENFVGHLS